MQVFDVKILGCFHIGYIYIFFFRQKEIISTFMGFDIELGRKKKTTEEAAYCK